MMSRFALRLSALAYCAIAVGGLIGTQGALAQTCELKVGQLVSLDGMVEAQRTGATTWQRPAINADMCQGDSVRVGKHSRAAIALVNDAVLRLDENTTMRLTQVVREPEKTSIFSLITGAFQSFSRKPRKLKVNTAYLNGTIEGTEFVFEVRGRKAILTVLEGRVVADNAQGDVTLAAGQAATAEPGKAPVRRIVAKPRDAVQWALHYPPVLAGGGATDSAVGRAAGLLNVGRIEEARRQIDRAISSGADAGLAFALRAVINVVQNQNDAALADAKRAVAASPRSAAAKIALSYAQQSRFDLEAARDTLLQAVKDAPRDALAWARLAEIWLSLGYRGRARDAATTATKLAPDLARTQTILGFAALTEFRIAEARTAFTKAIGLSTSDPLPRLGLGLAKINEGDLEGGRREIEIAVGLDSGNALLRSYLGKAYFEEKRGPLDATQLEIAKTLDPLDPTPYLYDAIRKQTEGRPGEALDDLLASIDRNDNRAVYRGRLQLDQDRAARGTSLARIYEDLGFSARGVTEASRSLTLDPGNASAHRFLSDNYRSIRRREIARVSELLQSQMLQDVNINPVQPSVSSVSVNVQASGGPSKAGFNEFTPLFESDALQFDAAAFYGSNDTKGAEAVASAAYKGFSLSAGAFRSRSDGFREGNELDNDIVNVFGQVAITPKLNAQAEYRRRDAQSGDLKLDFDPDKFDPDFRRNIEQEIWRLGLRYSPTPKTNLLLSYIDVERTEKTYDIVSAANYQDGKADEDGFQTEAQYQLMTGFGDVVPRLNVVAGYGLTRNDRVTLVQNKSRAALPPPPCPPVCQPPPAPPFTPFPGTPANSVAATLTNTNEEIRHDRGYLYINANVPSAVTWTIGIVHENFDRSQLTLHEWNPKFGVQWDVGYGVRLRAAAFDVMKPVLLTNRTLEPTQIAGFNQMFDDVNATLSEGYAIGADWQASKDLFFGAEALLREFEEPINTGGGSFKFEDRDEAFYRVYANWTPFEGVAGTAELSWDRFNAGSLLLRGHPLSVDTYSMPVGLRYFSSKGWFANLGATAVHQEVDRKDSSTLGQGRDTFVVVDTGIGYRLPNRLGIVSLQIANLFNSSFQYQDDSYREFRDNPVSGPYTPERTILLTGTLRF